MSIPTGRTLIRNENHDPRSAYGNWRHQTVTGHPPIPEAAIPLLRKHLCGWPKDCEPIRWWNVDGNAWAAVHDLHMADNHGDATALALLLRWCQAAGGGSNQHEVLWSIDQP